MQLLRVAVLVATALPVGVLAANGLNLIGFGAESVAMGGADTAGARDTAALNTNPAGLAQLSRPASSQLRMPPGSGLAPGRGVRTWTSCCKKWVWTRLTRRRWLPWRHTGVSGSHTP